MDAMVNDEAAKINNAIDTWGDMEYEIAGDIAMWILSQPKKFDSMINAINAFWSERLSYE
jgi:hypothetical protein